MSNDRILLAVNELISKYELAVAKNIDVDSDANLDILQFSNLHKMEMITLGFELGNNLDLLHNINKRIEDTTPVVETRTFKQTVTDPFEECSTEAPPIETTGKAQTLQLKPSLNNAYKSKYKISENYLNNKYDKIFNAFKNYEDKLDCINCKNSWELQEGELIPEYELNWQLKKFLKDLNSLRKDISNSLDSTKLLKDFCLYFELFNGENKLCLSSWPLLLTSFPVLINKARFQLLELGFSWTGIIGPIVAPLLTVAVKILELFKNLTLGSFDCIIRALRLMKQTVIALDRVIASYVEQAKMVGNTLSMPFRGGSEFEEMNVDFDSTSYSPPVEMLDLNLKNIEKDSEINRNSELSSLNKALTILKQKFEEEIKKGLKNPYLNKVENTDSFNSFASNIGVKSKKAETTLEEKQETVAIETVSNVEKDKVAKLKPADTNSESNESSNTDEFDTDEFLNDFFGPDVNTDEKENNQVFSYGEEASSEDIEFIKEQINNLSIHYKRYKAKPESYGRKEDLERIEELAKLYIRIKEYSKAYELLEDIVKDNRYDGNSALWRMGYIKLKLNDLDEAIKHLNEYKKREPEETADSAATGYLADALYEKGKTLSNVSFLKEASYYYKNLVDQESLFDYQIKHYEKMISQIEKEIKKYKRNPVEEVSDKLPGSVEYPYIQADPILMEPIPNNFDAEIEPATKKVMDSSQEVKKAIQPKAKAEANLGNGFDFNTKYPEGKFGFKVQNPLAFKTSFAMQADPMFRTANTDSYLKPMIDTLSFIENSVSEARNYVASFFDKFIYTLKVIQSLIVEPLFISSKLIGEIKVLLNMIRLVKVIADLINSDFKDVCKNFNDTQVNSIVKGAIENEFEDTIIDMKDSDKGILLAKAKDSDYVSRLEPNECGEILVKVNKAQRDLDLIYDKIANSIR